MYTGSTFDLDYRLAQIAVVVMHTFMFSVGLPILFLLAAINLTLMYWIDKYLILRVYKTPVKYDHKPISFTLRLLRWSFYFHFFIGFYMISCDGILSSNNSYDNISDFNNLSEEFIGYKFFESKRYQSVHSILFFMSSIFMTLIVMFQDKTSCCFKPLFKKYLGRNKMEECEDEVANDYYDLISSKTLVDEYRRTVRYQELLNDP